MYGLRAPGVMMDGRPGWTDSELPEVAGATLWALPGHWPLLVFSHSSCRRGGGYLEIIPIHQRGREAESETHPGDVATECRVTCYSQGFHRHFIGFLQKGGTIIIRI